MSAETESLENQAPAEVAALWTQLHAEATRRRDDLTPATSRRWLAAIIAGAFVVILLIGFLAMRAIEGEQSDADATATAVASAAAATRTADLARIHARETQVAVTATANWNALQTRQAEAANLTATAAVSATIVAATKTQAAAETATQVAGTATTEAIVAATQTAVAIQCLEPKNYAVEVVEGPELTPAQGTRWITDKAYPYTEAKWTIKNTGQCAWEQLSLVPLSAGAPPFPQEDITPETPVQSGESVDVSITFTEIPPTSLAWEFFIQINNAYLQIDPEDRIMLEIDRWLIPVSPTPTLTPTPTDTPTPVPSNTPVPPADTPTPVPTDTPTPVPTDTPTVVPPPTGRP